MGLLRRSISKLVEMSERFGDREEEWGMVTCRWDGGCGSRRVGCYVPILGMVMVRARGSLWLVYEVVMVSFAG